VSWVVTFFAENFGLHSEQSFNVRSQMDVVKHQQIEAFYLAFALAFALATHKGMYSRRPFFK
jgi:ABC-type antimicrobial peptide transport system permease subunit